MSSIDQAASPDLALGKPVGRFGFRILGPLAMGFAMLSAIATFVVLAGLTPILPTHDVVVTLLAVNVVTVAFIIGVIGLEIFRIMQARRHGRAAARLHVRIVGLFSVIAAVPAVLLAVVATVTLERGLDQLFTGQTRALIERSRILADGYVRDSVQSLRADTIIMAIELARAKQLFDQNRERFRQIINGQATLLGFAAVMMINKDLAVVEQADRRVNQTFIIPTTDLLQAVTDTEPQVAAFLDANYIASIVKLRGYEDIYLYVTRLLDPNVVTQLRATRDSVNEFTELEARRQGVQIAFALMYTVIGLSVLLSAVWIGLNFANYLVAPIRRLIAAAQLVSTGNLQVQVPIRRSEGDIGKLGESFNKMTQDLRTQRDDIMRARDLIDSRRRFTEAVLAGASAGVIGVDAGGQVSIMNRSAEKLIDRSASDTIGRSLGEVIPELEAMIAAARVGGQRLEQGEITITRKGRDRILSVRVTTERSGESDQGYVVTLDEITELVTAQRTAAWADVARRIAHEIKNPLTPIQLSAERLRRKYGKVITEDRAIFEQCTATIIRQVDDIKRMVDEFSKFARMPKPVMASDDVADTVRQAVFLMRVGNAEIDIELELAEDPMPARFDRRLISQGLTNLIKNAAEAIGAVPPAELGKGRILVSAARDGEDIVIDIVDNGIGLPKENRTRLLEPYFTTREKGTGLGLAIVARILEDHGGRIELGDAEDRIPGQRGAWMRLRFKAEGADNAAAGAPEFKKVATGR